MALAPPPGQDDRLDPRGPVVHPVGTAAVLLEVGDHVEALGLARWVRESGLPCTEVVPAARSVLVDGLAGGPGDHDRLTAVLEGWRPERALAPAGELVEVPVHYDGPDLRSVAELWGVGEEEVVRRHTGLDLVSAFCGFAPGFSYLAGLPPRWSVPRLADPRPRVPAGAVAVADRWCGIYPSDSPGGWRLLGRTDARVWDLDRGDRPSLLPPGTRVRFVVA